MDKSADGCNPALYICRPCVLDYRYVHQARDIQPPGKDSLIPVGGTRHLWLHVLLLTGIEQNDPCIKLHFLQFTAYLGVHPFCHILIGLGGALLCILTQKSDDLASDAFTGNLLCLLSSLAYAIYLIASNRILKHVGVMTMLRYTFSGAAFSAIIVSGFTGFETTLFTLPIHWKPMAVLAFVLIFPTVISYLLIPVGLKYLKTTLVAIYGYLILIVATITSLALGQDRFSWSQLIAVLLICSSVYFVEIAESKEKS